MLRTLSRYPQRLSPVVLRRFLSEKPKEVFTKLNDPSDPARNQFFQYTWGSWLKNDKVQRARRETRFSIEGVTKFVQEMKAKSSSLEKPHTLADGSWVLPHNWTPEVLGEGALSVKSIASIHEGKHHRVYKLTLANAKELVLRIPYKLDSDFAIENRIKSEVATLDFLDVKMGLNVPKVVAYGSTRANALQSPFILMEHIQGELLMKQWEPMVPDSDTSEAKLKLVIDPIIDFQSKALDLTFNRFGSLYFFDDVSVDNQRVAPYDGETEETLKDRWRIGPSVEKVFFKGNLHLPAQKITSISGPFDKPLDVISAVAAIHLESLKARLGLAQAGAGSKVEDIDALKKQIRAFENFDAMSQKLLNPESPSIMNVAELFKPRLFFPDLDPLNVLVQSETNKPYFVDFEGTSIKPFILASYPSFVAYHGAKIYNLEEDVEGYAEMDEAEKQQYQFMYYKTRNERLWEYALNAKKHDLIAVASPHIKVLRACYLQALECKNDSDYLYVDNCIVQLQAMWDTYVANGLVNATETEFPVEYDAAYVDEHQADMEKYQQELVSTPFAATGGWVPQDMFEVLKGQGILVEDEQGNFRIDTDAALRDAPKE